MIIWWFKEVRLPVMLLSYHMYSILFLFHAHFCLWTSSEIFLPFRAHIIFIPAYANRSPCHMHKTIPGVEKKGAVMEPAAEQHPILSIQRKDKCHLQLEMHGVGGGGGRRKFSGAECLYLSWNPGLPAEKKFKKICGKMSFALKFCWHISLGHLD